MIKEIELDKDVKWIAGKNIVNHCIYVMITFRGGYSAENKLELSHLAEHILLTFDYFKEGKIYPNLYMGSMRADAHTKDDRMEFTFCVLNNDELNEKLNCLLNAINNVVVNEELLEKEKKTILDELYQCGVEEGYIEEVKKYFKTTTIQDVYDYIKNNLTAENLTIFTLGNLCEKELNSCFNNFINQINSKGKKSKISHEIIEIVNKYYSHNLRNPSLVKNERNFAGTTVKLICELDANQKNKKENLMFDILISYINNFRLGIKNLLRKDKRLVYRTSVWNDETSFGIKAVCKPGDAELVGQLMQDYIEKLSIKGISKSDFEFIKNEKRRFMFSRPLHILEFLQRNILDEYLKDKNSQIDEELQKDYLKDNKVDEDVNKKLSDKLKLISTVKYEEFSEFIKTKLHGLKITLKIDDKLVKGL